ncbi:hypothetical protein DFH06DRAFT_1130490 [Mycena polygramma]|nr:hypothetical protein DFH06DRAFT_1130490 [Mycena polygramma]
MTPRWRQYMRRSCSHWTCRRLGEPALGMTRSGRKITPILRWPSWHGYQCRGLRGCSSAQLPPLPVPHAPHPAVLPPQVPHAGRAGDVGVVHQPRTEKTVSQDRFSLKMLAAAAAAAATTAATAAVIAPACAVAAAVIPSSGVSSEIVAEKRRRRRTKIRAKTEPVLNEAGTFRNALGMHDGTGGICLLKAESDVTDLGGGLIVQRDNARRPPGRKRREGVLRVFLRREWHPAPSPQREMREQQVFTKATGWGQRDIPWNELRLRGQAGWWPERRVQEMPALYAGPLLPQSPILVPASGRRPAQLDGGQNHGERPSVGCTTWPLPDGWVCGRVAAALSFGGAPSSSRSIWRHFASEDTAICAESRDANPFDEERRGSRASASAAAERAHGDAFASEIPILDMSGLTLDGGEWLDGTLSSESSLSATTWVGVRDTRYYAVWGGKVVREEAKRAFLQAEEEGSKARILSTEDFEEVQAFSQSVHWIAD